MERLPLRRALLAIATDQSGYFTAQQAREVGYSYQAQHYHSIAGDWLRVASGVYRLRDYPEQPREELAALTLQSRNRSGEPQAVVSHETALTVHQISDANPAKIQLTVPPGFRKRMPLSVTLHRAVLEPHDWEQRDGYRVTTPLRTLVDIASSTVSWPLLDSAVRDALASGLIRKKHLLAAGGSDDMKARLLASLKKVEDQMVNAGRNAGR